MDSIDWEVLARLRSIFLAGGDGESDYWTSESDLESYDQTFAQRIGWKWSFILSELKSRGWAPPGGTILDWGCGTGIASRQFLHYFPDAQRLHLFDRSPLAMAYATKHAGKTVLAESMSMPPGAVDVLLISHALTEQREPFDLPCDAQCVIVVEPGTYEASHKLIQFRERVRGGFNVVAPCTHQASCGLINSRHWCHHFAAVPNEVFHNPDWARFSKVTGIDLRSLPVSYLVLDKRPVPAGGARLIGRPRMYRGWATTFVCDETGVLECRLSKRMLPEWFRRWKKGEVRTRVELQCDGSEIIGIQIS